jgi:hypothetical protein
MMTQTTAISGYERPSRETELAQNEEQELDHPEIIVARATRWAEALAEVIDRQKMYATIGGKQYVTVEGWQVIGALTHHSAVIESTASIYGEDGQKIGYSATAVLHDGSGRLVSRGVMPCGFDDFPCLGKEGMAKEKSAISSAQTWSIGKAYRNRFAFVMKLAGFEPTPAEEMTGFHHAPPPTPKTPPAQHQYWCKEHNVAFFKTARMRGYGHPIETGGFCNMASPNAPPQSPPESAREPVEAPLVASGAQGAIIEAPEAPLKTVGQLMQRCHDRYRLSSQEVLRNLNVQSPQMIYDLDMAWATIREVQED